MLFSRSHVKISSFCTKAQLAFHWCLYNKYVYHSQPERIIAINLAIYKLYMKVTDTTMLPPPPPPPWQLHSNSQNCTELTNQHLPPLFCILLLVIDSYSCTLNLTTFLPFLGSIFLLVRYAVHFRGNFPILQTCYIYFTLLPQYNNLVLL